MQIKYLEDKKSRRNTFNKRKNTLLKNVSVRSKTLSSKPSSSL